MEDSIQLPGSDEDNQQINFFVSPNNSLKKPKVEMTHTASQESLAYSKTHAKFIVHERSPMEIQIPIFQTSEKPEPLKRMLKAGKQKALKTERSSPMLIQTNGSDELSSKCQQPVISIHRQRTKTMKVKELTDLKKKYKQVEYALQVEVISSQQLRTKVAILTELLEQKIKQSQFSYLLKLKNTSRNLSNLDIFVELKQTHKKLKEYQLIIEQQKHQIEKAAGKQSGRTKRATVSHDQKQNVTMNIQGSIPKTKGQNIQLQIQGLIEQKQSLFNYIEQLRGEYNAKNVYCSQIKQELQRYQQKQHKFVAVERAKFIKEIKQLQQEIQKLRMERNFIQLNYENKLEELNTQISSKQKQKQRQMQAQKDKNTQSIATMTSEVTIKNAVAQTDFRNEEEQLLKAELKLLKNERDYYIQQYKKKVSEGSQNYLLRLQIKTYENNLFS